MQTKRIKSLAELSEFAREILRVLTKKQFAHCIGLEGDLGAGKTALTKEIAKTLNISENVTSPTFVLMKTYSIPDHAFLKNLVHIDAYRVESEEETKVLNFTEILKDPTNLVVIEWPEKIETLIPKDALKIHMKILEEENREITY